MKQSWPGKVPVEQEKLDPGSPSGHLLDFWADAKSLSGIEVIPA
jgi:hypothetical protein